MHSLKAFLLSLTCIALCFGRSVAQTQQTDSSTAPAASASSAAPAAAAPASPEQIQAAVAEIKYVAEEGQRMGELYKEAKAAGECEEDDCELFHAMIELGQRYIELKHFLTSHGLKVEGYEYELCDKDDECPLTYDQHLSLHRPAADFVLYSTGEAAGATCGEMRWGMRELIVQILKAESTPQQQRELKNDLHYARCSFSECLGWAPTNCDIYDLAHLGLRNSPPPPAPGAGERVPPPRPASLLLHDRIQELLDRVPGLADQKENIYRPSVWTRRRHVTPDDAAKQEYTRQVTAATMLLHCQQNPSDPGCISIGFGTAGAEEPPQPKPKAKRAGLLTGAKNKLKKAGSQVKKAGAAAKRGIKAALHIR